MTNQTESDPLISVSPTSILESGRAYYSIIELTKILGCSAEQILDFGIQDKLKLSVMASNWIVYTGSYLDDDCVDEIIERDDFFSGFMQLSVEAVQELKANGASKIIYLRAAKGRFAKVIPGDGNLKKNVSVEELIMTISDLSQYMKIKIITSEVEIPVTIHYNPVDDNYLPMATDNIAKHFKLIKDDPKNGDAENRERWRQLAHNAYRNGLAAARASGHNHQGRKQSSFYPDKVADWLLKRGEMTEGQVQKILEKILPDL